MMVTADSVKSKIQGLIDTANESTGQNDTDLTSAVNRLKDGYGQGEGALDSFWEDYLNVDGVCDNLFSGRGWTDITYNPTKDIVCTQKATSMFNNAQITTTKKRIEIRCANMDTIFSGCSYLETVVELYFGEEITSSSSAFAGCSKLKNFVADGEIQTGLGFAGCPDLTDESVQSIIEHLKDLTGTTSKKITFHSNVLSRMTDEQTAAIWAKNWTTL